MSASKDTGTTNDYTSTQGVKASTTGTVYGIYDMSGGAIEYVAAYVNNADDSLTKYGSSLVNGEAKTKNVYNVGGSSGGHKIDYNANSAKYGDAVYETSENGWTNNKSWYNDYSYFPTGSLPFFGRGGGYSYDTITGVFYFSNSAISYNNNSFRPVLVTL